MHLQIGNADDVDRDGGDDDDGGGVGAGRNSVMRMMINLQVAVV